MFRLGMTEVAILLFLGLLLFGSRLPEIARWLGKSFVDFRRETNSLTEELRGSSKSGL